MQLPHIADRTVRGAGRQRRISLQRLRHIALAILGPIGIVAQRIDLFAPLGQLGFGNQYIDGAIRNIDPDPVAFLEQGDRPPLGRLQFKQALHNPTTILYIWCPSPAILVQS